MDKKILVKIISIITGTILIGVIIFYLIEGDWNQVGFFGFLFLGIWIIPNLLKTPKKK
tara:strand:- start:716 stop:889 length:174 start_codon:yes stop_codon:yes gene_type:complete